MGEVRIKITIVKMIIIVFSSTESTIVGLPISQNNGLNKAVKIANGATLNNPVSEPSNSPIL